MEWLKARFENQLVIEYVLTFCASGMLLSVGFAIRRYLGAINRQRPLRETIRKLLVRQTRYAKLKHFHSLARGVISDASEALAESTATASGARALIPIVCEVRKRGELLVARTKTFHWLCLPLRERRLRPLVCELIQVEEVLKSLPRPELSIEDVLAGKLE